MSGARPWHADEVRAVPKNAYSIWVDAMPRQTLLHGRRMLPSLLPLPLLPTGRPLIGFQGYPVAYDLEARSHTGPHRGGGRGRFPGKVGECRTKVHGTLLKMDLGYQGRSLVPK